MQDEKLKKRENLLGELNPEQVKAVTHHQGPLLVLSGAGSGKTRVITHRIAYLIEHYGVRPDGILGLTFTNKAAEEMNGRLNELLGGKMEHGSPWLGTFHALGAEFLRRYVDELGRGYDRSFTIYDQSDQKEAIKEVMVDLDISTEEFQPGMMASFINEAKNELIGPEEFRSEKAGEIDDYMLRTVSRIYSHYQEKLEEWNGLDFGDLIRIPTELLEEDREPVRGWKERFKFLLVDEYQDTNHAQYVLANQLAEPENNICVVGDDDQAIFGWRGADVSNILEFEEDYPNSRVVNLSKNYRSRKPILRAANGIISNNQFRKPKEMEPNRGEGEALYIHNASDEEGEAEFLANRINQLWKGGVELGEIAILYRVNPLSRGIEKKLVEESIPYEIVRGTRFYERKEIKDVLGYLRVLCNPDDDLHLLRIVNTPRRGIGKKTQEVVRLRAREEGVSIWSLLTGTEKPTDLSGRQWSQLKSFVELIKGLRGRRGEVELVDFVNEVVAELGYFSYLEKEYDPGSAEDRKNNVRELIGQIKDMDSGEVALEDFLENIALESDVDEFEDRRDKVSLLTLHSAKGLEFGYVFLAAMEDGLLPHRRSLDEGTIEEERRLCYVGLTRAKERVFLSYTDSRFLYGQRYNNVPSRFLGEIPDEELERVEKGRCDFEDSGNAGTYSQEGGGWKDYLE
ncbi:UvrD-helicase domain-containing protein [Candidatus Bipolaricaulota bacterium]|nr:UvrD-helicase domain-containing protein [Candidatus Bipolaricaulota bacterium]